MIQNWLTNRHYFCEIVGKTSSLRALDSGTVQGSILGPLLFALYIAPLEELIGDMVNFADDNYNIGVAATEEQSISNCVQQTEVMINWLNDSGLVVNQTKTVMCVFSRFNCQIKEAQIMGQTIEIKRQIRVLGVVFDSGLTWYDQVTAAVQSANRAKQGLQIIAKYFSKEELLKLATAYFYSRLYFGAKVWLISTLAVGLKKLLLQSSSRMLQIVDKDYQRVNSYVNLHKKYKRALPEMWGNYMTACALHHVLVTQSPSIIVNGLTNNVLHERRRQGTKFTRSNEKKIGFNCLFNRVQFVTGKMNFNWMDLSPTLLKSKCKQLFIMDALSGI